MFNPGTILPVVGVTFYQPAIATVEMGDPVTLIHQADNPYDGNAVAILSLTGDQLGHLPAAIAGRMTDPAQGGQPGTVGTATISAITNFELEDGTRGRGLRLRLGTIVPGGH